MVEVVGAEGRRCPQAKVVVVGRTGVGRQDEDHYLTHPRRGNTTHMHRIPQESPGDITLQNP